VSDAVVLTGASDGVGLVTINRPALRNAINREVIDGIRAALHAFAVDQSVGLVVFTGAGDRAFAAGADIAELEGRTILDGLAAGLQRLYDEIEGFEKPTIAAVNGYALGGSCELALACDIRLASERARFGLPETALSNIPGAGGTQRLARLVGRGRALELILTGRAIEADEALRIGLVSSVVAHEALMDSARKTAAQVLAKGPLAVRLAKLAVQAGYDADQRTGLVVERLAQSVLYATEDKRKGTSAFLAKREPAFRGR
jgi:enoyl-CoA hydratase/carnithine racemase